MNKRPIILGAGLIAVALLALSLPQQQSPINYDWRSGRTQAHYVVVPNDPITGTELYHFASPTEVGGVFRAVKTAAGQLNALGVCIDNCGTTGNAVILVIGQTIAYFDGPTTANHFAQNSSTVAGQATDVGTLRPTRGKVIGRIEETAGSAGLRRVLLFGIGVQGGVQAIKASIVYDFPSLGGGLCADVNIAVTGAVAGDAVSFSHPTAGTRGVFNAWVSAADQVTIRHCSINGVNDPPSATYNVAVLK